MKLKTKQLKLALGEGSHTHIMESKKEITYEQFGEVLEFVLADQGIITHEEHDKIILQPGSYTKYPQTEYDPFSQSMRAVFD